jgi:hypothetical protein
MLLFMAAISGLHRGRIDSSMPTYLFIRASLLAGSFVPLNELPPPYSETPASYGAALKPYREATSDL